MTLLRTDKTSRPANPLLDWVSGTREVLNEERFRRSIAIERKRTERSSEMVSAYAIRSFRQSRVGRQQARVLDKMVSALVTCSRETDLIGWYTSRTTVGVIFADIVPSDKNAILSVILRKVSTTLRDKLTPDQFAKGQHIRFTSFLMIGIKIHSRVLEVIMLCTLTCSASAKADGRCLVLSG